MFKVSILDQERKLFEDSASQVRLPGADGEYAVMDFHTP
ncbi:MAG: F0F1 ATP synthase subunit epsilon, partial [Acidobacteriota bacterium]